MKYTIEYWVNKEWGQPEKGQYVRHEEEFEGTLKEAQEHANGRAYDISCDLDQSVEVEIYETIIPSTDEAPA